MIGDLKSKRLIVEVQDDLHMEIRWTSGSASITSWLASSNGIKQRSSVSFK